jgi:phosphoglycolate phosphatase-like HAD superfamily hydrolase
LTGNFQRGAAIKLAYFDLWQRFPFGAFGDDALDRRELVPVACARCHDAGLDVSPAGLVIIGDTPLDVDCAHAHGAMAVAVATGLYTVDALREAGADVVVETLEALDEDGRWLARLVSGAR